MTKIVHKTLPGDGWLAVWSMVGWGLERGEGQRSIYGTRSRVVSRDGFRGWKGLVIGGGLRMESLLIFTLSSFDIQFESAVEVKTDMGGQAIELQCKNNKIFT